MDNNLPSQSASGSPLRWIGFIIVVLVLGGASFAAIRNNPTTNNPRNSNQNPQPSASAVDPIAPHTLVYGSWTGDGSEITAIDLASRVSTTIATLPVNIKKVTVLSPDTLIYMDEATQRDHGKKITIYDIKEGKVKKSIPAERGFGFDDYVVSPNKQYVALWEVSFAGGPVMQRSRVYAVNISNHSVKNLLYDEVVSGPVHYPRAILDNGKVFTDTFQPNDPAGGVGWSYGMSVVNFDGSGKQDLSQMQNGTYGNQPSLSPDGKYLLFAGYDGSRGPGTRIKNGYRQAVVTPNTVELLNTQTLKREQLQNLSNANFYSKTSWDMSGRSIKIVQQSTSAEQSGVYSYNLGSKTASQVALPTEHEPPYQFLTQLSNEKLVIATIEESASGIGNLGSEYAQLISQLYIFEPASNNAASLQHNNGLIQYITTLPQNYFQYVLGVAYAQGGNPSQPNVTVIDLYSDKPAQKNLQLKTFVMKPELAPIREEQQTQQPEPTEPPGITIPPDKKPPVKKNKQIKCADLAAQRCAELGRANDMRCLAEERANGMLQGACYDSPLYLYGKAGEKVNVKIQAKIYNDNPKYMGSYDVTLQNNGKMLVNNEIYSAINYDYLSNLRKISPPTKGTIVPSSGIENTLREYARKLGLNEKETADLVKSGKAKVTSPYVFISFFDHDTSSSILPLSFIPEPDNYLNVVFYFKLLDKKPNYTPAPPTFTKPINRTGLTAIEVSEIVE